MIKDIPTAADFKEHGMMFLNLAWEVIIELKFEYSYIEGDGIDDDQSNAYWRAAKRSLSIAHVLAQQGAELILKSQIAIASPLLLIANSKSEWPSNDIPFADFRTIDAQDIIRMYDSLYKVPLPEPLKTTYEKFRKQRNALFHTVDKRLKFSAKEIIRYIVSISHLVAPGEWPQIRGNSIEDAPFVQASGESDRSTLFREIDIMIEMLTKSELRDYFGFEKGKRRYICPYCYYNTPGKDYSGYYPRTAQLQHNTAKSSTLHCFVCRNNIDVLRKDCLVDDCKGNVINAGDDGECLTCFAMQEET